MRPLIFWAVKRRKLVAGYRSCGTSRLIVKGQATQFCYFFLRCLTVQNETDILIRTGSYQPTARNVPHGQSPQLHRGEILQTPLKLHQPNAKLVGVNKEEFDDMRMHGMEYLKIIDAQQAKLINNYKIA